MREMPITRDSLASLIEQHSVTTEELQTANEELRCSNEELQTSNEALESTKRELEAINKALACTNRDLFNLLSSIQVQTIVVDHDLRIRRFSPSAKAFF
jgi:two-component system CheB/CheR fusion protein